MSDDNQMKIVLFLSGSKNSVADFNAIKEELECEVCIIDTKINFGDDPIADLQKELESFGATAFVLDKGSVVLTQYKIIANFYGRPDSKVKMLEQVHRNHINESGYYVPVFDGYQIFKSV
jgi:hypothetical protein